MGESQSVHTIRTILENFRLMSWVQKKANIEDYSINMVEKVVVVSLMVGVSIIGDAWN